MYVHYEDAVPLWQKTVDSFILDFWEYGKRSLIHKQFSTAVLLYSV